MHADMPITLFNANNTKKTRQHYQKESKQVLRKISLLKLQSFKLPNPTLPNFVDCRNIDQYLMYLPILVLDRILLVHYKIKVLYICIFTLG